MMDESNPAAGQPEKVGPYRLERRLGVGGMGAVWRAHDERLKRLVALKRILPASNHEPMLRERFRREAEAVARLNHPAIVHVYDIVETETSDWIVMELVEGRTLQELLQDGPLDPQRALRVGSEIAHGLAEAHSKGFIHRDLKAANVMVTLAGRAKVLDFGVAKQILPEAQETTLSSPGTVVGTSYAMSPEQAMGLPVDARSDLFSLGSLLYEMVTGVAPFRSDTAQTTLTRVCSFRQRPASSLRPDMPRALSALIDRLLEKDPVDRPGNAPEVAAALDAIAMTTSLAAATQSSRREIDPSDQLTVFEAPPASLVPAPSSIGRIEDQNPLARQKARGLWVTSVTALLLIIALVAVYLPRTPLLESTPQAIYQEGMVYLDRYDRKGNLDLAIDSFQTVIARDGTHAAAHASLAKAYWLKFQSDSRDPMWLEQALSMGQRAVALDPYLADARTSLGLALGSAGQHEQAIQHVQRALVLEPLNDDAYYAAGKSYQSRGKLKEAEAAYKKAVEIGPHRLYLDELGSLYIGMGRTAEAIAVLHQSLKLAPDGFIGYRNLGVAHFMQGDVEEAASLFQKALQIRPDATVYANLGTIHFSQGLYQQAVEAFEKAIEMQGGSNNHMVWGNLGDAYRWTPDKKERAHDAYRTAIQLLQEQLNAAIDPTLRSRFALYLAKSGDTIRALGELDKIQELPDNDASSWFRVAVAYEVCDRRVKALAALERALRAGYSVDEVKKDPELLELRADKRYHRLTTEINGSP
jgi:serine/threonine-protein kinase